MTYLADTDQVSVGVSSPEEKGLSAAPDGWASSARRVAANVGSPEAVRRPRRTRPGPWRSRSRRSDRRAFARRAPYPLCRKGCLRITAHLAMPGTPLLSTATRRLAQAAVAQQNEPDFALTPSRQTAPGVCQRLLGPACRHGSHASRSGQYSFVGIARHFAVHYGTVNSTIREAGSPIPIPVLCPQAACL